MGLIIALDDNNKASGELFWDDGDSRSTAAFIHFQQMCLCSQNSVTITDYFLFLHVIEALIH